jgi:hypothetical protein
MLAKYIPQEQFTFADRPSFGWWAHRREFRMGDDAVTVPKFYLLSDHLTTHF